MENFEQPSFNKKYYKGLISLIGLIFLGLNLGYSYFFYHVNSYKLFFLGTSVTILFIFLFFYRKSERHIANHLALAGILLMIVFSTLPGLIVSGFEQNYYFPIEFSSKVFLIIWAAYVVRSINSSDDLDHLLFWIKVTLIYACFFAFLEKIGLNPFLHFGRGVDRVKSTFGNINYFAGFLTVIIPLVFSQFLFGILSPDSSSSAGKNSATSDTTKTALKSLPARLLEKSLKNKLTGAATLMGLVGLALTQTRAAQGAVLISIFLLSLLILWFFSSDQTRKNILRIFGGLVSIGVLALILIFSYVETVIEWLGGPENRYAKMLTPEGYYDRLVPWYTAWDSIMASPLFGWGLGSSYNLFFNFVNPEVDLHSGEKSFNHVHNEHLEFLEEAGFVGGIILYFIIFTFIFQLIRIIKKEENPLSIRYMATGCIAGISAFYIHGLFSVAQRMIVAQFPFFTLLGISFVIIINYSPVGKKGLFTLKETWSQWLEKNHKKIALVVIAPLLVISWGQFYNWATPFVKNNLFHFSGATSKAEIQKHTQFLLDNPSVYLLHNLMYSQIRSKNYRSAIITGDKILEEIPHYRNVTQLLSKAHFQLGNEKEGLRYLDLYAEKDRYNIERNTTLFFIGLKAGNRDQIIEATEANALFDVARSDKTYKLFEAENLEVEPDKLSSPFQISVFDNLDDQRNALPNNYCNVDPDFVKPALVRIKIDESFMDTMIRSYQDPISKNFSQVLQIVKESWSIGRTGLRDSIKFCEDSSLDMNDKIQARHLLDKRINISDLHYGQKNLKKFIKDTSRDVDNLERTLARSGISSVKSQQNPRAKQLIKQKNEASAKLNNAIRYDEDIKLKLEVLTENLVKNEDLILKNSNIMELVNIDKIHRALAKWHDRLGNSVSPKL